jgi:sugar transferase (PEP-CTERM/EpsH1 system associated)
MGGMENGLVNLIHGLPESKYRHAIACIEDYSDFRNRIRRTDVDVFALRRSKVGVWGVRGALYRLCRTLRPAIVHSRNQSGLDALLPSRAAGVRRRIHGEHGWDVGDLDGRRWKPAVLRRLHTPLVDRYVTVSQHLERYLVERIGIAPRRITQIYNGVDTDRFAPAPRSGRERLRPDFRDERLVILGIVGRLQPVKDYPTVLHAMRILRERRPDLRDRLRLAAFGDGPRLAELTSLASALGLEDRVWFAGSVEDVPDALRSIDFFALSSLNEGISNTILEAMASGLPVVATSVGGNVELVESGVTGSLFEPGDMETLAGRLADYVGSPELRARHGAAGRARAVERFSLGAMTRGYEDLYDGVLGVSSPGPRT